MDARLHQKNRTQGGKPTLSESSKNIAIDTKFLTELSSEGWFSALSSVFLMKPGVHCQAKRQNKFENIHLSVIYRKNTKQRKHESGLDIKQI